MAAEPAEQPRTRRDPAAARRQRAALRRMAAEDPELAARLVLATLPGAAARVPGPLRYDLHVEGVGDRRVEVADGAARVEPLGGDGYGDGEPPGAGGADGAQSTAGDGAEPDFRLSTDPRSLVELAAGVSPLRLMLRGDLRIRGRRRRALRLRAMADADDALEAAARSGADVDPGVVYAALPYLVDPEWTRGHRFTVAYEVEGSPTWYLEARDGESLRATTDRPDGESDASVRVGRETFRRLIAREITPPEAIRNRLIDVDGKLIAVTTVGRWIDRALGTDEPELAREREQRDRLSRRGPTWGASGPGSPEAGGAGGDGHAPAAQKHGQGDPGHGSEGARRDGGGLLDYQQLYALWERQNWRAHELDFSVDREQWLLTPTEAQNNTRWSLGSFYAGEERVTADLAPFVLAAPSGEVEVFLTTQLVDEARHAAFFDRFGAEVMALEAGDLRGRLNEIEAGLEPAWRHTFDAGLRDVADRLKASPDDLELFVEGVTTYHMVIEGVLATTGQLFIREYMEDHGMFPGFCRGFALVERDEHRHIAFGVRFLKEMVEREPRYGDVVERTIAELVPSAAGVFAPPFAEDPADFHTYGYHSSEIYGYAYRALKRRMAVIGLEVPPAEELMPGPIASPEADSGPAASDGGGWRGGLRTARRTPGG